MITIRSRRLSFDITLLFKLFSPFHVVVTQTYNTYGDQEDIIRGNSAILKCKIPSFVADFLEVVSWVDDVGNVFTQRDSQLGTGFV